MKSNQAVELKNEGNDYFKQGDYEKALQCYGKAVELVPDYRDAWSNIYLTLLKQERMDEAVKCKDILDKLAHDPKSQPKAMGVKHFSLIQKVFIVIITILLVIAVVVAIEALMGIGSQKSGPNPIGNTLTSLAGLSPVGLDIMGNHSSDINIPSSTDMVSNSFDAVQKSLITISPLGLDIPVNNTSGINKSLHS